MAIKCILFIKCVSENVIYLDMAVYSSLWKKKKPCPCSFSNPHCWPRPSLSQCRPCRLWPAEAEGTECSGPQRGAAAQRATVMPWPSWLPASRLHHCWLPAPDWSDFLPPAPCSPALDAPLEESKYYSIKYYKFLKHRLTLVQLYNLLSNPSPNFISLFTNTIHSVHCASKTFWPLI